MIRYCPKCPVKKALVWQPAKMRYYCPVCHRNYTTFDLMRVIEGGKK